MIQKRYSLVRMSQNFVCVFDWTIGRAVTMNSANWQYISEENFIR